MSQRTRRRSVATFVAGVAIVLGVLLVPEPATAGGTVDITIDQVGWWTNRPGANSAGDGGFETGNNGGRAVQSIGAMQITSGATTIDSLGITLVESSALAEFGSIRVCPTGESWSAADPGALADAPAPDCSRSVLLTRSADAGVWLGELASVYDGGTASLMFVPEYSPPTSVGPGTIIRISEIRLEATGQTAAPTTSSTTSATTSTTAFRPTPTTSGGFTSPPTTAFRPTPTTAFVSPESNLSDDVPVVDDPVPVDEFSQGDLDTPGFPALGEGGVVQVQGSQVFDRESKPWIRLLVVIPVSAGLGVGAVHGKRYLAERVAAMSGAPT